MPEIDFNSREARNYAGGKAVTMTTRQRLRFYSTLDELIVGSFDERITDYNMVTGLIDIVARVVLEE